MRSVAEFLERLVAFPTLSKQSNLELLSYVQNCIESHQGRVHLIAHPDGTRANLFASFGPKKEGGIAFSGHSDVVPVEGQNWSSPPFRLRERNGKFYGRGTADMKGFTAAFLSVLPEIRMEDLRKPFHLILSFDEEIGCLGVPLVLEELGKTLPRPELAIIGEPSQMKIISGHKAIASFETKITGLEAHSSMVNDGVNAIEFAARAIMKLIDMGQAYKSRRDDRFDPPCSTIHTGVIAGGQARNIIPKHCHFLWEMRAIPDDDIETMLEQFKQYCALALEVDMKKITREAHIHTEKINQVPGLNPVFDSVAEQFVRQITGDNEQNMASFVTEAGQFQQAGIPAIIIGPGNIAQAHKPDEWIESAQLEQARNFIHKAIARFCTATDSR